jgi:hypothetical protein
LHSFRFRCGFGDNFKFSVMLQQALQAQPDNFMIID